MRMCADQRVGRDHGRWGLREVEERNNDAIINRIIEMDVIHLAPVDHTSRRHSLSVYPLKQVDELCKENNRENLCTICIDEFELV